MVAVTKQNTDAPAVPSVPAEVKSFITGVIDAERKRMADEVVADLRRGAGPGGANVIDLKGWTPRTRGVLPPVLGSDEYENRNKLFGSKGIRAAQLFKVAMHVAKFGGSPTELAKRWEAEGKLDPFVAKAIVESLLGSGGSAVPPQFSAEFIPLLRARAILLAMGIRVVAMESDQLIYARQNAPATAYYVGEVFATTYSQLTTGNLKLAVKILKAVTAVSDQMLRDGGPAVDELIRDDLVKVLALRMDLAGLRGDGTSESPLGLRYSADSGNIFAATQAGSAASFQEIANDIEKMERLIEEANVPIENLAWAMAPRSKHYLKSVSSTYGVFPFKDEINAGKLNNWPIFSTTQIPTNLGGGTESEVYLLATQEYLFGERDELIIQAFPGGTFQDATGSLVSGISTGQVPISGEMRHDFALRYTKAVAILTTVKWGV